MKIAIIGAGAVGSLLAGYLSPLADVRLISRRADSTLEPQPLTLRRRDGTETAVMVQSTADPAQSAGWADVALVCVKTFDTEYAAQAAQVVLNPVGIALTLQNGLGNVEKMAAALGENRAVAGVSTNGATLLSPRTVYHSGAGNIQLAIWDAVAEKVLAMRQLFENAGLPCTTVKNVDSVLWGKLIINAGINALTAILGQKNGFLVDTVSARAILADAVTEATAVANALGVSLPHADPVAQVLQVAEATRETCSSMLSDVSRRSRTEIDAINGEIVRRGAARGISVPVNRTLVRLIHALEAGYPADGKG